MQSSLDSIWSSADYVSVQRNIVFLALFMPMVYFGIVFPLFVLLGIEPYTAYYVFDGQNLYALKTIMLLNSLMLLTAFAAKGLLPKMVLIPKEDSAWVVIVLFGLLIVYFNYGNSSLDREVIKSEVTAVSTLATSLAHGCLAGMLLVNRRPAKLAAIIGFLLFSLLNSFERELILYFAVPIIIRLSDNPRFFVILILFSFLSVLFLGGYKFILITSRLNGFSLDLLTNPYLWQSILRSFLSDNLHKTGIEVYFFIDQSPNYNYLSYLLPTQVLRVLDPDIISNGNLATEFYTGNNVGTGFSILLESWLNFGVFGVLAVPLILFGAARRILMMKSPVMLIVFIIFSLKLQRSDLWPLFVSIIGAPMVYVGMLRLKLFGFNMRHIRLR